MPLWSSYRHLGLAHGKAEAWFTDHRVTVIRLRLMLDTPSGLASSCVTDAMGVSAQKTVVVPGNVAGSR